MTTGDHRSIACPHCDAEQHEPLRGFAKPEPGQVLARTRECPACGRRYILTAEWEMVTRAETFPEAVGQ